MRTWTQVETAEVYEKQIHRHMRVAFEVAVVASPDNIYNRHALINCILVAVTKSLCEIEQAIDPSLTDIAFAQKLAKGLVSTYEQWAKQKKTVENLKRLGQ
jgi:hypothetical protein